MTEPEHPRPPALPLVLVVDDDTSVGGTFERILVRAGYCVHSANSFEEASELLMQTAFDAAVVDICLGKKDGLDLLARCREINPDLPVIMVTGFPTIETATSAVRLNAYEYLTKPINNQKLIQSVGRAVEVKVLRDAKRLAEDEKRLYQRDLEMLVTARTERLVRSHKRYQLLFENSKDAIFMADWTGRFIAINRAAVDLFGHERSEMVLLQDRSLFPTSDSYVIFKREIEQNGFVKDLHAQLQRKDNVLIDCLLTAHLIAYNKEIEGYQVIVRDVTLQKQAERKIQAQNAFLKTSLSRYPIHF